MKLCPTCNKEKEDSEFYSRGKSKSLASKCKECFNAYCVDRWRQRKIEAIAKFGGKCIDCNKEYHYSVFDFHHLYDKDVCWDKLRKRNQNDIDRELSKCVLLCSNCHRLRHYCPSSSVEEQEPSKLLAGSSSLSWDTTREYSKGG